MNQQQQEKRHHSSDGSLEVHSIFQTIQGEGPFAGHSAIFIRLAGCNLQCPKCDTDYTSSRKLLSLGDILFTIGTMVKWRPLVVITGGEPFRQDIYPLCRELIKNGFYVQIETNGTLPPSCVAFHELASLDFNRRDAVFVVCSPKTGKVHPFLEPTIGAYKYVMTDGDIAADGLPFKVLDHKSNGELMRPHKGFTGPVYIQPADLKDDILNRRNMDACVASCRTNGYILQLQIHKHLGVD